MSANSHLPPSPQPLTGDCYSDLSDTPSLSWPRHSAPPSSQGDPCRVTRQRIYLSYAQNLPMAGHLNSEPESGAPGCVLPPLHPAALACLLSLKCHPHLNSGPLPSP